MRVLNGLIMNMYMVVWLVYSSNQGRGWIDDAILHRPTSLCNSSAVYSYNVGQRSHGPNAFSQATPINLLIT
jgi:hypothetical protein